MKSSELEELTLLSAVKSIRDGEITSVELTESLLERIEATELTIKAYTTVCREESISMAEEADRKLRSGSDKIGLLHGIPVTVKDSIKTKGIRTTAGSRILAQNIPSIDATVVRILKNAGAFVLGKSNTHEFALGGMTPPTKNPWDFDVVPGGSSGGSAASTAASSAIAALGSDTGGSIRIPASYCGVVGLKPTYGRVSRFGVYPESWSLDHVGPITKTVEDCALMMNVISGYDSADPNSASAGVPDFLASIDKSISGVKIGVPRNYFFDHLQEEVLDCVQVSIKKLEKDYDAVVVPFDFPNIDLIMAAYTAIDSSEVSSYHEENYLKRKELYQPDVRSYMELGFLITATQYLKAMRMRSMLSNAVEAMFSKFDVVITPSQPMTAPRPDSIVSEFPRGFRESTLFSMARLTAPFNLTGHPALTINCGFSKKTPNPLPIGLQITGRLFDEGTILRVGNAFEKVANLRNRHPVL